MTRDDQPLTDQPTTPVSLPLGVIVSAVRQGLSRATAAAGRRASAWVEDDAPPRRRWPASRSSADTHALVAQLQSEIDYLRGELTAAREQAGRERERADVLHHEALQRVEALRAGPVATPSPQAPPDPEPSPETSGEGVQDAFTPLNMETQQADTLARVRRWMKGN